MASAPKHKRTWREAASINALRVLLLFIIGASPVLARVALLTPLRVAVSVGGLLAAARHWRTVVSVVDRRLPIPAAAREAVAEDAARFVALTVKGPFFRGAVALIKRVFDCQRLPLPPASLRPTGVRTDACALAWAPTVASWLSEERYRLEVAVLDTDWPVPPLTAAWQTVYDGPLCRHELSGLAADTAHAARVCAHNGKGASAHAHAQWVTRQVPTAAKGGTAPAYSWSQDEREVLVRAPVPAATRAADVLAACTATALSVRLRGGAGAGERVVLAGVLHRPVDPSEFAWQLVAPDDDERESAARVAGVGARVLELTLLKADGGLGVDGGLGRPLWPAVIGSYAPAGPPRPPLALLREHPRIDVTLVAQAAPELGEHHFKEVRHGGGELPGEAGRAGSLQGRERRGRPLRGCGRGTCRCSAAAPSHFSTSPFCTHGPPPLCRSAALAPALLAPVRLARCLLLAAARDDVAVAARDDGAGARVSAAAQAASARLIRSPPEFI
jgi:hypothetical protein